MHHWTDSALGHYLLEWEQQRFDEAVADIFGYHALQLGLPQLQGLRGNRMPHRWLALEGLDPVPDEKAGTVAQAKATAVSPPLPPADEAQNFAPLMPALRTAPEALPLPRPASTCC